MGSLFNPGNTMFYNSAMHSEIYVDKTGLIDYTNRLLFGEHKNLCVSRPRRFGKSMAANMLAAYYGRGCDSRELFSGFKIASSGDFEKHLNKYNVIKINIIDYLDKGSMTESLDYLCRKIIYEIKREYPDLDCFDWSDLLCVLDTVFVRDNIPFIFIIDEWDSVFRRKKSEEDIKIYLDFLRNLLKDKPYSALAYMTGILPIKKYGEHSALNMFEEYSMTNQYALTPFTGFTEDEVKALCDRCGRDYSETKRWYDGYNLNGISVYNPRSVVLSVMGGVFDSYWTKTETYEALKIYIQMNFDGLRDKVTRLIAGDNVPINPTKFRNDMTTFGSCDDVLTLLVHLGYLTFDFDEKTVRIPNSEVHREFINSIEDGGWDSVINAIKRSDELLRATLEGDSEKVAELIEMSHTENSSILKYNDENSLACVISLAYYSARTKFIMHREYASGKGFADVVYIPRKNTELPAMVIELKHNKSADTAVKQIKSKKYADKLSEYSGEILLVGITYNDEKEHSCVIERVTKQTLRD